MLLFLILVLILTNNNILLLDGYENNIASNDESFFIIDGERWFNTGDMGYLDNKNYLFISGRSKEIINRGLYNLQLVTYQSRLVLVTVTYYCIIYRR